MGSVSLRIVVVGVQLSCCFHRPVVKLDFSYPDRYENTHTGKNLNKCDQCNYSSTQAHNLKTHYMREHTVEKSG